MAACREAHASLIMFTVLHRSANPKSSKGGRRDQSTPGPPHLKGAGAVFRDLLVLDDCSPCLVISSSRWGRPWPRQDVA